MTVDELLDDLSDRIDRGLATLERDRDEARRLGHYDESRRLVAKHEGMAVVKDWLRAYPRGEQ